MTNLKVWQSCYNYSIITIIPCCICTNISLGYLENKVAGEANMCRGLFQVDSLLDISQPAYSQLQKLRGTDCANDEVSAVTQASQRPWEAKPTRMLLLQV